MSRDNPVPRCRTWNFSHTLYTSILPEATRGLHPTSTIDPFVLIKSLFEKLFKEGPAPVFYIHLRVSRAAFDLCVSCGKTGAALPDLPFAGFIQARSLVGLSILQPWLDARWTPVGSKLHSDPRYRNEFLAPEDPSFLKPRNVGYRRSPCSKQWIDDTRIVQVWVESLQIRGQQDQVVLQFVPYIFCVDGVIAPQGPQRHRRDSTGKDQINFKFSIFKC